MYPRLQSRCMLTTSRVSHKLGKFFLLAKSRNGAKLFIFHLITDVVIFQDKKIMFVIMCRDLPGYVIIVIHC